MPESFGIQLKHARKVRNLTQSQLAKMVGVSPSCIGMLEQNRRKPDGELLKKLSNTLNVSVDYLLNIDLGREDDIEVKKTDAIDVINDLTLQLEKQQGLMYNGKPISKEDMEKLAYAIRIAGEIALRQCKREE